jgi:hypothetical protein
VYPRIVCPEAFLIAGTPEIHRLIITDNIRVKDPEIYSIFSCEHTKNRNPFGVKTVELEVIVWLNRRVVMPKHWSVQMNTFPAMDQRLQHLRCRCSSSVNGIPELLEVARVPQDSKPNAI